MESDSDGDDYETLATLAVAIASFAKRKHNLSSKTRTVAAWEVVMKEMDTGSDEDDDTPRVKLTRRVLPRPEYSTSAWAEMLRCCDAPIFTIILHITSCEKHSTKWRLPAAMTARTAATCT